MTGALATLAGLMLLGLAGLGFAAFGPEARPAVAVNNSASTHGCSSCDARHRRLGQSGLSTMQGDP